MPIHWIIPAKHLLMMFWGWVGLYSFLWQSLGDFAAPGCALLRKASAGLVLSLSVGWQWMSTKGSHEGPGGIPLVEIRKV